MIHDMRKMPRLGGMGTARVARLIRADTCPRRLWAAKG
jgi:hypothetical protein